MDYYQVLELESRHVTDGEIKAAYRRLARKWHPDVNPAPGAASVFKTLTRAFQTLGDHDRRREYDQGLGGAGGAGAGAPPPPPPGSTRQTQQQRRGADLRATLSLSLGEAVVGGRHRLEVRALSSCGVCRGSGGAPGGRAERCQICKGRGDIQKTWAAANGTATSTAVIDCPACGARGLLILDACPGCDTSGLQRRPLAIEIAVPPGTEDGAMLRVPGRGDAGECGGDRGDLFVRVAVRAAAGVERRGLDLHSDVAVPLVVAILGGTVTVATLTEGPRPLRVPPGTPHGAQLTVERGGVLGRGAHHFRVRVSVPREVTPAEAAVLRRLAEVVR